MIIDMIMFNWHKNLIQCYNYNSCMVIINYYTFSMYNIIVCIVSALVWSTHITPLRWSLFLSPDCFPSFHPIAPLPLHPFLSSLPPSPSPFLSGQSQEDLPHHQYTGGATTRGHAHLIPGGIPEPDNGTGGCFGRRGLRLGLHTTEMYVEWEWGCNYLSPA